MTYYWVQFASDTGPNAEEEFTSKNSDNGGIHEDQDDFALTEDTSTVTSKLSPKDAKTVPGKLVQIVDIV